MNIFYTDQDAYQAAKNMVDKHVVKMVLETAQLLSTAHRLLDGKQYTDMTRTGRFVKRWKLPDHREDVMYSATHINHPSAVWCRQTAENYMWLFRHFAALTAEYTHRYGKMHKCEPMGKFFVQKPFNIPNGSFTPVTPAMPDQYKVDCSVQSYRNYYKQGKAHLHNWTKREQPEWMR